MSCSKIYEFNCMNMIYENIAINGFLIYNFIYLDCKLQINKKRHVCNIINKFFYYYYWKEGSNECYLNIIVNCFLIYMFIVLYKYIKKDVCSIISNFFLED